MESHIYDYVKLNRLQLMQLWTWILNIRDALNIYGTTTVEAKPVV